MKSVAILFIALTMLLKPLWPIADYIVNYDYIVNVLCENRDQPQLNCDGKCYLSKQLAKESEDRGKNPFEQRQNILDQVQPICIESLLDFKFAILFGTISKQRIKYSKSFFSSPHVLGLIQPPEVS